jgi:hypothetical protein
MTVLDPDLTRVSERQNGEGVLPLRAVDRRGIYRRSYNDLDKQDKEPHPNRWTAGLGEPSRIRTDERPGTRGGSGKQHGMPNGGAIAGLGVRPPHESCRITGLDLAVVNAGRMLALYTFVDPTGA